MSSKKYSLSAPCIIVLSTFFSQKTLIPQQDKEIWDREAGAFSRYLEVTNPERFFSKKGDSSSTQLWLYCVLSYIQICFSGFSACSRSDSPSLSKITHKLLPYHCCTIGKTG
ncbi:uncharacterized protein LOC110412835 isoform X2 [Herrania umbratica]|uniref:Uncharacterized protein LOC110412835 isoform X2 n=1 Tax=Herrania umbratica TaxID=108875 RepID=A0A6J0ZXN1_9ROSI|nr:uncharacterized protein LOC110412835 isoform X2 [Herrania umbratica]